MVKTSPDSSRFGGREKTYKLPPLNLAGDVDIKTAAQHIFSECSHHLHLNVTRYSADKDERSLMQIRVGMRRTRVAMKAFKFIIQPEIFKKYNQEFRYFGNLMGDARDLDVFLNGMMAEGCPYEGFDPVYGDLRRLALARKEEEYRQIHLEITGGRLETALQAFDKWQQSDWVLQTGHMGRFQPGSPVSSFALEVIEKGRLKILGRGASIHKVSFEELHVVRKYVKRSRYHLRFFVSLFNVEKISKGYDLLVAAQDELGHINDVREGVALICRLAGSVQADRISEALHLMSALVAKAGDDAGGHLKSCAELLHQYELYEVTKADLR